MTDQYFLTEEDIKHYNYMLSNGYEHEIVTLEHQKYVIFEVLNKPYIGIAWPTVTGLLDGSSEIEAIFEFYEPTHSLLINNINNKNIKILLSPRYSHAS